MTDQSKDLDRQGKQKQERPTVDITGPAGGWPDPWPNVAELAEVLPADQ